MSAAFRHGLFCIALSLSSGCGQPPSARGIDPPALLNEAKLAAQPRGSTTRIYRLMIAPTWGNRVCLRLQNTPRGDLLVFKRLEGQAGYGDGPLTETKEIQLTAADFRAFEDLIADSGYEKMGLRDPDSGLDGESWSLEVSKAAFHHTAIRWCPNAYHPKKRGTEGFVRAFRWATDKADVTKSITNKGHAIFDR